ncbi:MAG: glycosyltransferase family 2 protein [Sphaerochaeta sp.]
MEEKVSVIIPVYNTGKYLKQCVDSVINQTYENLQIILVDDGSTDDSGKMCDEIALTDNRIQVVHKANEGLGLTRNKGLEYADGRFVTFLDSDDWFSKDHVEVLVSNATRTRAELVIGSRTKYYPDQKNAFRKLELSIYGEYSDEEVITEVLPEFIAASPNAKSDMGIPMSVCFNLYLLDVIRDYAILFPSERYCVSEDFFFNYKYINRCKKAVIVKEYGYIYRNTPMSISHSFGEEQIVRVFNFYTEIKKLLLNEDTSPDIKSRMFRCSLSKIRSLLTRLATSTLSYKEKIKLIKAIISAPETQEMVLGFDYRLYPMQLRIFTLGMKYQMPRLIYALLYIRQKK